MHASVAIIGPCDAERTASLLRIANDAGLGWAGHLDGDTAEIRESDWVAFASRSPDPWILVIDPDERLTAELAWEIRELPDRPGDGPGAYRIPITVRFLGRTIVGGSFGKRSENRLVHRDRASQSQIRSGARTPSTAPRDLTNALEWRPFTDLEDGLSRIDRETSGLALELATRGRRARAFDFVFRPPWVLARDLVARGGLRDGMPGFVLATLVAARELILYAKLWEQGLPEGLRQVPSNPAPP